MAAVCNGAPSCWKQYYSSPYNFWASESKIRSKTSVLYYSALISTPRSIKTSSSRPFLEIADAFWYRGTVNFSRGISDSDTDHTLSFCTFSCCSRTNIFSSEKNISSPACQLSRIFALLKRFSTVAHVSP
jgi:hypothetical protein